MLHLPHRKALAITLLCFSLGTLAQSAYADGTELEVYRDDIADAGESNLDFAANAVQTSRQDDGQRRTVFQAVGEYAYGIDDVWQVGVKLPVSYVDGVWRADGLLSEIKFVLPHGKTGWYWGAEFEIGYESTPTEKQQWTIEATPIAGVRAGDWEFVFNPGLSISSGDDNRGVVLFEPSAKLAYRVINGGALGVEYFSEAGPIRSISPGRERNELAFVTFDTKIEKSVINFGVGHGVNGNSPGWAIKMVADLEFD
jgi:hypothetical protein